MMKQNVLEVVYASNDGYARHLGVSLCSLHDRNQDMEEIRVHILSMGISGENRARLQGLADRYKRKLVFVEIENLEDRFDHPVDTGAMISALCCAFLWQRRCLRIWIGCCIWTVILWWLSP